MNSPMARPPCCQELLTLWVGRAPSPKAMAKTNFDVAGLLESRKEAWSSDAASAGLSLGHRAPASTGRGRHHGHRFR